jgi:hypothetical protein
MLVPIPGVGGVATAVSGIARIVTPILRAFGLEKPDSDVMTSVYVPETGREGVFTDAAATGIKLTGSSHAYLRAVDGVIGKGQVNPTVLDLARVPGLYKLGSFDESTVYDTKLIDFPVVPCDPTAIVLSTVEYWDLLPIDVASKMYAHWRGSINYMFFFAASKFSSCRVRICYFASGSAPANVAGVGGDIPSIVVDITGDTTVHFTTPFLCEDAVARTGTWTATDEDWQDTVPAAERCAAIGVYVLAPVQTQNSGSTPVRYSVWKAAGSDFQLIQPIGKLSVPAWSAVIPMSRSLVPTTMGRRALGTPSMEPQCRVQEEMRKQPISFVPIKGVVEDGLVSSEELVGIAELARRATRELNGTGTTVTIAGSHGVNWLPLLYRKRSGTTLPQTLNGIDLLMLCTMGYRGGMRWAFSEDAGLKYNTQFYCGSGDQKLAGMQTGALRWVTIPYNSRSLYLPTLPTIEWSDYEQIIALWGNMAQTPAWTVNANMPVSAAYSLYYAMGDDGHCATFLPPPLIKRTQV